MHTENDLPQSVLQRYSTGIDHMALAVPVLQEAIAWYVEVLGFEIAEQRTTEGHATGMVSAVLRSGDFVVVLVQGTSPDSQVSRYLEKYGPGVQHLAIAVSDLAAFVEQMRKRGLEFCTT
ncbi:MAG: VOC family protein, partial [Myxococcota bacterium]